MTHQLEVAKKHGLKDPTYSVPPLGTNPLNSVYGTGLTVVGNDIIVSGFGNTDAGPVHALKWSLSGGSVDLGSLSTTDPTHTPSYAFGISRDGSTIVGASNLDPTNSAELHAFRWTETDGMMHDLGLPSGVTDPGISAAYGVNQDGSVIVGTANFTTPPFSGPSHTHAFRWTSSGFEDLGTLAGSDPFAGSTAYAVTPDGSVVVGSSSATGGGGGPIHAFRWTASDHMVDLGVPSGMTDTAATAVSDNGKVVVGISSPGGIDRNSFGFVPHDYERAFRWTPSGGMKKLGTVLAKAGIDMTGTTLLTANTVSHDGQYIGGAAIFPDTASGDTSAYLARYCDDATEGSCTEGVTTPSSVSASLGNVTGEQNAVANNVSGTADGLLGFNQPVGGTTELGGFGAAGSFTLGSSGRWDLTSNTTLIGGIAFTKQSYSGADVTSAGLAAAGLRYTRPAGKDLTALIEGGGWVAPGMDMTFTRTYANGSGTSTGSGSTNGFMGNAYARAGVVWTPKPTREIALSGTIGHTWVNVSGYAEATGPSNPFPATFADRSGGASFVKAEAEWTEALTPKWDMTLSGAIGRTFGTTGAVSATVTGLGGVSAVPANYTFEQYGARVGYKLSARDTVDVFALGTSGGGLGSHFEIGTGFRARL